MKLETFFEKFDQFSEAPNAVAKMRELILQLAVQGKLTPQDTTDGDADLLLRDIAEARSAKGRGKQSGIAPEEQIAESDQWFKVPPSWCWVRLSTVGNIAGGGTPRSDNAAYFAEEGIPWLTPADLNGYKEKRISRGRRCITPLGLASSSAQLLPAGSVLFSSRAPIGYVAIADTELATNQGFKSCVPFIIETNEFLYYFLKSAAARIDREASGTTFREVSGRIVSQIPVPLPPLAEQKRIVAKVDELMALCDRMETQQQERDTRHAVLARASLARFADAPTPENLNLLFHPSYAITPADLRKTILTLAVQGKLVPQDANDEPASELFDRIQSEQTQLQTEGLYRSFKPLPPIGENDKPFPLPLGWDWLRLRSLVFTLGDGLHGTPEYSGGTDCYFINGNNLVDGRIVIKPHTKTVSFNEMQKHKKLMTLNTVLVSINGTLGSVAFYNNENVVLGKSACYFNLSSHVDKHFVGLVIESPYFVNYAIENATGTTIRNLGLKSMNYFPVPLPPLVEQRRIVAKVDQLMALVDQLETQLAASRATATNLMEAVVAELTAQE